MADSNTGLRKNPADLKTFYDNIMKKSPLLYGHQFIVYFTGKDLPEVLIDNNVSNDVNRSITYYVKSSSIPEVTIEETTVSFLSQEFVIPKQVAYGNEWTCQVMLDQNMYHYRTLYAWQNTFARLQLDGGGSKIIPNVQAHVCLLDASLQNIIHKFTLEGVFPTKIPDLTMEYQNQANIVDFSCTFTYQYLYDDRDGNPLDSGSTKN